MTDDIKWGPWSVGNGKPLYKYRNAAVQFLNNGVPTYTEGRMSIWLSWYFYRLPAHDPHYTPEGQLYYLKQQFPDVAWVQALEAPEAPEPVDPVLLKAREIYMRRHYSFRPDVCDGSWDHTHEMKLIIEGIKAGMEMKK